MVVVGCLLHGRGAPLVRRAAAGHSRHDDPQHAAAGSATRPRIGVAIRASSDDALRVEHGSLYPALHRFEKQDWSESEWKLTENEQRAKYYRLTRAGRKQLAAEESKWNRMVQTVAPKPAPLAP